MIDLVLATPDAPGEQALVVAAPGCGIRVVRRCVDAVDLLAVAALDPDVAILLTAGLPRLSAEAVDHLASSHRGPLVGLALDRLDVERLEAWGVRAVADGAGEPAATWRSLRASMEETASAADGGSVEGGSRTVDAGVWSTGVWEPGAADGGPVDVPAPPEQRRAGHVVVVWGPMGSPGRTTVAIGIAEALAASGARTCLVDADTYAPSVAMALGIVDDSGGLLRACRLAESHGTLAPSLSGATRVVRGSWHVMTGLASAADWADLHAAALDRVWSACRAAFDATVIDVGFCLEADDAPVALSRRRNSTALTAVAAADRVLAVADASAVGAARLASAWPGLQAVSLTADVTVVANRASGRRSRGWPATIGDLGIHAPVVSVPQDARALESCLARGASLGEGARRSPVRRSLVTLAAGVLSG
ncbi:MAG: hypothetical protein Q7V58_01350 [Actinomycetota bacterium]|nr:hypothetical protein [Actinomycetota bacterium]